jgi:hypothetical protein
LLLKSLGVSHLDDQAATTNENRRSFGIQSEAGSVHLELLGAKMPPPSSGAAQSREHGVV